jgi:NAD(P)-dependent dehydrogenase (short-subunit alcohol dehydrogenase family)
MVVSVMAMRKPAGWLRGTAQAGSITRVETADRAKEVLGRLFDVKGTRVIVTGAASGLGLAMAEVLAQCGAHVTLADVAEERLDSATERLSEGGARVRSFAVDVRDEEGVRALFDDVVAAEGGVDVVFANAGLASVPGFRVDGGQTIDTIRRSDWDTVLDVNLNGVMHTMRAAAAVMKRQRAGRIVVTSSNAGLRPEPLVCYGYAASKAAVIQLVRHAALELAPHGVLVNAICPGPFSGTLIGGGVTEYPTEEMRAMWATLIPLGRMADPEELKGLVVLLASPASSFITGAAHVIDGGSLVQA